MVTRLLLMMILMTGLNACMGWGYYHEPIALADRPVFEGISQKEQQAVSYCLGEDIVVPADVDLDCSVDGKAILRKMKNNTIQCKGYVIESEALSEKHNESNEE